MFLKNIELYFLVQTFTSVKFNHNNNYKVKLQQKSDLDDNVQGNLNVVTFYLF